MIERTLSKHERCSLLACELVPLSLLGPPLARRKFQRLHSHGLPHEASLGIDRLPNTATEGLLHAWSYYNTMLFTIGETRRILTGKDGLHD